MDVFGSDLLYRMIEEIVDPAILFIFSLGFLLFVWGMVEFVRNLEDESGRKTGRDHMLWGIFGMFIMVSAWGIISLITDTFGLDIQNPGPPSSRRR